MMLQQRIQEDGVSFYTRLTFLCLTRSDAVSVPHVRCGSDTAFASGAGSQEAAAPELEQLAPN